MYQDNAAISFGMSPTAFHAFGPVAQGSLILSQ